MRPWVILVLITVFSGFGFSQTYHFPDTVRYFNKTTNFGTVHGYLEVINDSGDTVPMQWISRRGTTCPAGWNFNFDDQNNFYGTVNHLDSAAFDLYPPGTFPQKMIIGLSHNGLPGIGSIYFTIFPRHERADSTVIEFHFTILQGTGGGDTTDTLSISPINGKTAYTLLWQDELMIIPSQPIGVLRIIDLSGNVLHTRQQLFPGRSYGFAVRPGVVIVEARTPAHVSRRKFARWQ